MKKLLICLFVALVAMSAKAQEGVYVGGSLSFWGGDDVSSFGIAPEVGYNFSDKWAVGGMLILQYAKANDVKVTGFAFSPYVRYTFFENKVLRLFADGNVGVQTAHVKGSHNNTNGFEVGVRPGLEIKATKHLSFLAKFAFLGYRDDYLGYSNGGGLSVDGKDLSFGLYYTF